MALPTPFKPEDWQHMTGPNLQVTQADTQEDPREAQQSANGNLSNVFSDGCTSPPGTFRFDFWGRVSVWWQGKRLEDLPSTESETTYGDVEL